MFYFGIPSYKRAGKVTTIDFLYEIGAKKNQIFLSTQNLEDFNLYKELYGDKVNVIYGEGYSLSDNRNTLIDNFPEGTELVILDDDIKCFDIKKNNKLTRVPNKMVIPLIEQIFKKCKQYNCKVWSFYPVNNAYFMKDDFEIKFNCPIICLHGLITTELRYNNEYIVKEDYDFVCRNFNRGYGTMRLNNISIHANHYSLSGGCKDQWETNDVLAEKLLKAFPKYLKKHHSRQGEVLMRNNIKIKGVGTIEGKAKLY